VVHEILLNRHRNRSKPLVETLKYSGRPLHYANTKLIKNKNTALADVRLWDQFAKLGPQRQRHLCNWYHFSSLPRRYTHTNSRNNIIGLCKLKLPHDRYPWRWRWKQHIHSCAHRKKRERQLLRALFPPPSSHQTAQIQLKGPESEILTRAINQ
jgi:hypothetical protein